MSARAVEDEQNITGTGNLGCSCSCVRRQQAYDRLTMKRSMDRKHIDVGYNYVEDKFNDWHVNIQY